MTASVELRPAVIGDEAMLLGWANDPATRAASRARDPIAQAEHHRWLERRLATPDDARIWIGEHEGQPVGVVRFERLGTGRLEVSITVAPEARGRGLGGPLLEAGVTAARAAFDPVTILAEILPGNDASTRLFTAAGFSPVPATEDGGTAGSAAPMPPGIIRLERR